MEGRRSRSHTQHRTLAVGAGGALDEELAGARVVHDAGNVLKGRAEPDRADVAQVVLVGLRALVGGAGEQGPV